MYQDFSHLIISDRFFFALAEKNKATNYHLGTLKAKIAKLKSELINGPGGKSAGSKDAGRGFDGKGSLTAFYFIV